MRILVNFHKILLKFTTIRMDFQLTNFFGEFYMIFFLSAKLKCVSFRSINQTLNQSFIQTLTTKTNILDSPPLNWLLVGVFFD
jgi:hypothetical protein